MKDLKTRDGGNFLEKANKPFYKDRDGGVWSIEKIFASQDEVYGTVLYRFEDSLKNISKLILAYKAGSKHDIPELSINEPNIEQWPITFTSLSDISEFVKKQRNQKKMSQELLAKCCAVSTLTIKRLESGKHSPSADLLILIVNVLGYKLVAN